MNRCPASLLAACGIALAPLASVAPVAHAELILAEGDCHHPETFVQKRLDGLAADEETLRRHPEDRKAWLDVLDGLRRRARWELDAARRRAVRDWRPQAILDDPEAVSRRAVRDLEALETRYLQAFPAPDDLWCFEESRLGPGWSPRVRPLTAEAILAAPIPEDPAVLECRATWLGLHAPLSGTARSYARRALDAAPDDPRRHAVLAAVTTGADPDDPAVYRAWSVVDPTAFEPRVRLVRHHLDERRDAEALREIDDAWPHLSTSERSRLCREVGNSPTEMERGPEAGFSPGLLRCFERVVDNADADDPGQASDYEWIVMGLRMEGREQAATALILKAPETLQLRLWLTFLGSSESCAEFLKHWRAGAVVVPSERLPSGEHPARPAASGLQRCEAEDDLAAWRDVATARWGAAVLDAPKNPCAPDPDPWEEPIAAGLAALTAGEWERAAEIAGEVLEASDATPRRRAEARYLLGRVAYEDGDRAAAADHLEAYFLTRLRFTGCHSFADCDQPLRVLLDRLGGERLERYRRDSQRAEREYLDTLTARSGVEGFPERGELRATAVPWRGCGGGPCPEDVELDFWDETVFETAERESG